MLNHKEDGCYLCGRFPVEEHHIVFGTSGRPLSEKWGVKVYLCPEHHRGNTGVHHNNTLNLRIKQAGQRDLDARCGKGAFFKIFGRNYLEEENYERK